MTSNNPNGWTWTQDRQWASSDMRKNWSADHHRRRHLDPTATEWLLDVRTERIGDAGELMGQLAVRMTDDDITMSIEDVHAV